MRQSKHSHTEKGTWHEIMDVFWNNVCFTMYLYISYQCPSLRWPKFTNRGCITSAEINAN